MYTRMYMLPKYDFSPLFLSPPLFLLLFLLLSFLLSLSPPLFLLLFLLLSFLLSLLFFSLI